MSDSTMSTDKWGTKLWRNSKGQLHRIEGPAAEYLDGHKSWYINGLWLGNNVEGFWEFWDKLTTEQKQDSTLLSYLPGDFGV